MSSLEPAPRYVMLDRDGTINVDRHYLSDPADLCLLPGAAAGLIKLRDAGFRFVVMTNQSGVARGVVDPARLPEIHARLKALLADHGVEIEGIYICPHGPDDGCICRKPSTGLVDQAVREFGFDPRAGYMIGDKQADVDLGRAVGATAILVRTGYGAGTEQAGGGAGAAFVADDLSDAAAFILKCEAGLS